MLMTSAHALLHALLTLIAINVQLCNTEVLTLKITHHYVQQQLRVLTQHQDSTDTQIQLPISTLQFSFLDIIQYKLFRVP